MARIVACRLCRVELEAVAVGRGRAVVVCVQCETMGFHDEMPFGGPHWPLELGEGRGGGKKRGAVKQPKSRRSWA